MRVIEDLFVRISPARTVALKTLEAVADGAYASDSLRHFARWLADRDAGLASQIVFGCLRLQKQLDFLVEFHSSRPVTKLDRPVLIALRSGIFQLRYLDRVPAHAAVHDTVAWVKTRVRSAAGFANAVLRKVGREPVNWPDMATALSIPGWMLDRWTGHFGADQAAKVAQAALEQPLPYIRVAPGSEPPAELSLDPTDVPGAYRVGSALPGEFREHPVRLHDISSQAIIPLLGLRPGLTYLDLCAAPGNKTLQALECRPGLAIACDVSLTRIRDIPPVCPRVLLDATQPLPFKIQFDRVFIDAPCSGTGTLARNPEIKWRVKATDFALFGEKQAQILEQGCSWLKPGGTLVYATCSLETEENEAVVRRLLESHPEVQLAAESWRLPGRDEGDGFYAAVVRKKA